MDNDTEFIWDIKKRNPNIENALEELKDNVKVLKEESVVENIIKQAEELRDTIKRKSKEIDNPALVMGILNELDFFIENVEDPEGDE